MASAFAKYKKQAESAVQHVDHSEENTRLQSQLNAIMKERDEAKSAAEKTIAERDTYKARFESTTRESYLTKKAAEFKANVPLSVKLLSSELTCDDSGKMIVRNDPTASPDEFVSKYFSEGEGKALVSATLPQSAGIPTTTAPVPTAPVIDLKTSQGATAYARTLTSVKR